MPSPRDCGWKDDGAPIDFLEKCQDPEDNQFYSFVELQASHKVFELHPVEQEVGEREEGEIIEEVEGLKDVHQAEENKKVEAAAEAVSIQSRERTKKKCRILRIASCAGTRIACGFSHR